MATVTAPQLDFFGKPGCKTNRRQRAMLRQAGVDLKEHDLLNQGWTPAALQPFLQGQAVSDWFNKAAPAVRDGEVEPDVLSAAEAMQLLCEQPILIRRPLLRAGDWYQCGFDRLALQQQLGVQLVDPNSDTDGEDDEGCRHTLRGTAAQCQHPAEEHS